MLQKILLISMCIFHLCAAQQSEKDFFPPKKIDALIKATQEDILGYQTNTALQRFSDALTHFTSAAITALLLEQFIPENKALQQITKSLNTFMLINDQATTSISLVKKEIAEHAEELQKISQKTTPEERYAAFTQINDPMYVKFIEKPLHDQLRTSLEHLQAHLNELATIIPSTSAQK